MSAFKNILILGLLGGAGYLVYRYFIQGAAAQTSVPIALSQGWTMLDEVPPGWDTTAATLCTEHPEIQQITYSSDGVNWDYVYIPGWPLPMPDGTMDFAFKSGMGPFALWADPGLIIYPEGWSGEYITGDPANIILIQQSHVENNWVGTAQLFDVHGKPMQWVPIDAQYSKNGGVTWLHYTSNLTGSDGIVEFTISAPANLVPGDLVRCVCQDVVSNIITTT